MTCHGNSVPVPPAPAVTIPAASIMVIIAATSTPPMTICRYENRETAAHCGQEQSENDQTNVL
ncbi:MAG: hypothetical protein A2X58_10335 [Nitrospirae bacterium GWC2_56_14]|nr:MAG: hypothetical protein A2X58_10335 [Nitrospirae bacterium GWC2_56_14]